ncbi:MAG TPA: penicillin-binding protein 2 [Candidatus Saccharimonadales bacterium]|jgi:penicillin-binding protein 2|nr:penicillin-binding protein 2 [Candidatus Saccharimonadales bacterium]
MLGHQEKISQVRLSAVQYAALAIFLVLSYGLWSLQIHKSDEYESQAQQNRTRVVPILAPRGKILDREGRLIVDNYPSFSALLLRDQVRELNADAQKIAQGLHISAEEILDKARRSQLARIPDYQPIIIKDDITPDENAFIEAHRDLFPELEVIKVHRRLYPRNGFMAHLIGYVGEVSEDMLNSGKYDALSRGAIVGQSGVEQQYNDILMGKDGSRHVVVDSKGREVTDPRFAGKQVKEPATVGTPLTLTIDLDVQKAAELALEGKSGAVVALDPRNGEVLAMASRPTFDPNDFAIRISRNEWNRLLNDPGHPLLNRAIQAQLAPGSVFKIVESVAGLEEGVAENLRINCPGGATFYGHFYKCHKVHGAGVDISRAIYQSCDTFFYNLAERLGISRVSKWAMALGLGKKTGVDLPNEASGVMPSEEWKIKNYRQKWYAGETISVAIGQGAVTTTPIQLARTIGGIAMGGVLYRPHVVATDQLPPQAQNDQDVVRVPVSAQNWITITDAMSKVLLPGGTASSAHLEGVDFAGKTGSAQVVSNALRKASKSKLSADLNDNGWFVGVAPRRNPEIVVCVLFQGGEHGTLAGRLAAQVIKAYVDKQRRLRKDPALFSDKTDPGSVPVASFWHGAGAGSGHADGDADISADSHLQFGTMMVKVPRPRKNVASPVAHPLAAALPGVR